MKILKDIKNIIDNEVDLNKACLDIWNLKLYFIQNSSVKDIKKAFDCRKGNLFGPHSCPYCVRYSLNECNGCPIKESTGFILCEGTPYVEICELMENVEDSKKLNKKLLIKYIKDEIKFLEQLK